MRLTGVGAKQKGDLGAFLARRDEDEDQWPVLYDCEYPFS